VREIYYITCRPETDTEYTKIKRNKWQHVYAKSTFDKLTITQHYKHRTCISHYHSNMSNISMHMARYICSSVRLIWENAEFIKLKGVKLIADNCSKTWFILNSRDQKFSFLIMKNLYNSCKKIANSY
jgi:hypothetical protein